MKSFRTPDIHAPRFKKKFLNLLNASTFDKFKKEHPEYDQLDVDTYKKIVKTFNGKIWQTVIDERDGISLPENLGFLFVGTCEKPKVENINYGLSTMLDKSILHTNLESNSKLAKIFYTNYRGKYKFANRDLWKFTAVRQFKRTLAKEFPERWMNYINIKSNERVSQLFGKSEKTNIYINRSIEEILDTYDEFNFE